MDNIVAYISSRNNYEMLEGEVLKNVDLSRIELVNVDDDSCKEQQEFGKRICARYGIKYVPNGGRGLFMAAKTAVDFVSGNNPKCKFVFWLTHDCYPITKNFFQKLDETVSDGKLDQFGCVGFNTVWKKYSMSIDDFRANNLEGSYCGAMGRAVLTKVPGAGWYRSHDFEMPWNVWGKNVAVESVVDMNLMINVSNFQKYVIPDGNFHHFCWGDDLGLQFLKNNVYNITLANFYVYHDQSLKTRYSIPENSARAAQAGDNYHFCHPTHHLDHWMEKWKFHREWQKKKDVENLNSIKHLYKNTLIHDFIEHDYTRGPIKHFDFI